MKRIICLVGFSLFLAACGAERQNESIDSPTPKEAALPPATIIHSQPAPVPEKSSEVALSTEAEILSAKTPQGINPENESEEDDPATETPQVEDVKRVLILGDSLAATGFGVLLEKRLEEHPQVRCFRKAKSASGLARPDFFDWIKTAQAEVKKHDPHLVLVIIGGNDGQDLTPPSGKGSRVQWQSESWEDAYRQRTDELLAQLSAENRQILWLGLPKMGLQSFEKKLVLIRAIQQDAIADLGEQATYLDTISMTSDEKGNLQKVADVGQKKNQRLREEDGIHFTMAGSAYMADQVYPKVLEQLKLAP